MRSRRSFLAFGFTALAGCGQRRKAEGFPGYAFVANEDGKALAVVDLGAFAVTRHIPLGASPTEVLAHPAEPAVFALTPETGMVHEVDADSLALRRHARCGLSSAFMRLTGDGSALWLVSQEDRSLVRLPLKGFQPDARIPLPAAASDFALSPDGLRAAAGLGEEGTVALVNLAGRRVQHIARVGEAVGTVRYRKDGNLLLVANLPAHTLSVLEPVTGRLVVDLPLAVRPDNFCFKSDGGQLFVTGEGMDAVVSVYPYQTQVGATILAGHAPGFLAASTAPDYLFVANPRSGNVTILDIQTQRVLAVTSVGREPCHITVTPDNQYALVLNRQSGDMAVIRIAAISGHRRKLAPLFTMIPVGSGPVSTVVRAV